MTDSFEMILSRIDDGFDVPGYLVARAAGDKIGFVKLEAYLAGVGYFPCVGGTMVVYKKKETK